MSSSRRPVPGSRTGGCSVGAPELLLDRTVGGFQTSSSSVKRDEQRRCIFDETALGDLALPERVDVRPLLLECTARRLDETSLLVTNALVP